MKYGFEIEFFLTQKKTFVICPKGMESQMDECGWLAEARGKPKSDPIEAAFSCLADIHRLKTLVTEKKLRLSSVSYAELTPELMRQARRTHGKRNYPEGRGNIHNLDFAPDDELARAGLHIHFSDYYERKDDKGVVHQDHCPINMPKIIQAFDKEFEADIYEAKRLPGFYEMKSWGFEYRSLPNTINLVRVAEFIQREKF